MRLLPNDKDIGWVPYIWLAYLLSLPITGYYLRSTPLQWAATFASVAVFLVLYFRAYWVEGRQLLWIIGLMMILGIALSPINPSGAVYFVYASSFAGKMERPANALRIVAGILLLLVIELGILHLPIFFIIYAFGLTLIIGVVNIYYGQLHHERKKLVLAQEEIEHLAKIAERERIARDLHDVLGHTLSVIVLKSELASKLADIDTTRAIHEIKDVERISRDALAQVRATIQGYHSRSLQAEALQATAALEAAGVHVNCMFAATDIPATHEGVLALALREAVTNVIRHAKATTCTLSLNSVPGGCQLEIRDDGCGQLTPEGTGLSGMRKRVEDLGGNLLREVSVGTRILITLPETSR